MNGSPTLKSDDVSTSADILGWHVPAIPCDAVLRYKHTRAPQKKITFCQLQTHRAAAEQDEQQQQHRQSRAEQEDLFPASPMLFLSFCYDAVLRCSKNVVDYPA